MTAGRADSDRVLRLLQRIAKIQKTKLNSSTKAAVNKD
jgi:hypothetical protein